MDKVQILIIDDNPDIAKRILKLLQAAEIDCQVTRVTPDRVNKTDTGTMISLDSFPDISMFRKPSY